jgi:lipoprotein-releasing system ATP-binding protein
MLSLVRITKSFPQRGIVLDELSLEIGKGGSFAFTGPSGSGKTTLLNIIGTLEKPDSGELLLKGASILNQSPDESALFRNRNVGFVFQEHLLLPHLTVIENILLPVFATEISESLFREKEEYAEMLMAKTGISEIKDKYPFNISGGEAQRVTLVRALINKPSLLLADEPTGSLDSANAEMLGTLLTEMNREFGVTLIIATHSESLASKMKQHLKLENGKLKQ